MGRIILGGLVILAVLFGLRQYAQMGKNDADISYISHGELVDLAAAVPATGYAIVEFTADW